MRKTMKEIFAEEKLELNDFEQRGTSKLDVHPYSEDYEPLFEPWRDKPVRLLEIGALYGASTIMWDKYFPYGDITVVDIQDRSTLKNIEGRIDPNRTRVLIGDAYTQEFADKLGTFDIINDDGPHSIDSMIKCLELYFPKLNPGGFLIIEDIPQHSFFEKLKAVYPEEQHKCIEYHGRGVSDSRVFIIWKKQ